MPKTTKPKILILVCDLYHGGVQRIIARLSHQWAKTHEVTIVVNETPAHTSAYPMGGRIHYLNAPHSGNLALKVVRRIQRYTRLAHLIRQQQFAHLIAFQERSNFQLIIASMLAGTLSRTTASVRLSPSHMVWDLRVLMRVLYHLPKRVVVISLGIKQQLIAMGIPARKIEFIPNPSPPLPSTPLPRPKFKGTFKGKYILAVGRLNKQKGFDLLLHAYADLLQAMAKPAPPLVIVGDGEERQPLTQLAKTLGIAGRVIFVGMVDNPESWYAHAELFVLSSRFEGWGNVTVEAMAQGCAVVSFDCPVGPGEIITHGKNGLLVANGDVAGLTKGMAKVLGDGKLRQRLGEGGKKRARDFAIDALAPLWLKA